MPQLSLQLNLQQYIHVRLVCTASGPLGLLLLPTSCCNIHIHAFFFFFCKILSLQFELFIIWHQRINRGEKRLTLLLDFCILSYLCLGLAVWRLPLGRLCLFLSPYFPPFTLLSKLHSEQRHQQPVFPEYGMKTYIYKI